MTYSSGGLIQASDFNDILGAAAGTTGGGTQFNPVWATGFGNVGYGQTPVSNVAIGSVVSASSWASLFNNINNARLHQVQATVLTAPVAGFVITYRSALTSNVAAAYNDRLTQYPPLSWTSTSFTKAASWVGNGTATVDASVTFTVTAASVDQMRYFWNCGGNVKVTVTSATNNNGTSRSASMVTLLSTNFESKTIRNSNLSARTGAGGTVTLDTTSGGFWGLPSANANCTVITSTSFYTGDYMFAQAWTNGITGSYGGNGNIFYVTVGGRSAADGGSAAPDAINMSANIELTVTYPETTYLTNSWGTLSIT